MQSLYQTALNAQQAETCILNHEGVIVFVNEAWRQFGRENGADLAFVCEGANYLKVWEQLGADEGPSPLPLKQLLAGELSSFSFEYPCHSREEHRWFLVRFTQLVGPRKEIYALVTHENITAQRQAEKSINTIIDQARCLLWSGTVEALDNGELWWRIHFQDEAAALRFLPIEVDPEKGFVWSLYLARPEEDRLRSDAYGTAKICAGESYSQEFRCQLQDGRLVWLKDDVTVQVVRDGLWNVTGVITDITQQKQAEHDIQQLMLGAHCLLWHATVTVTGDPEAPLQWDLQIVNEEAANRFFPVEQAPGETYTHAWTHNRIWESQHKNAIESVFQGRNYTQEFRLKGRGGRLYWLQEDVQVEPLSPGRWRAVGVCTDITPRKDQEESLQAQEQHLRLALEGGELGSWHVDFIKGEFIQVSPHLRELVDIAPDAPFLWEDFVSRIHPEDTDHVWKAITDALASQDNASVEFRLCRPDGSVRWMGSYGRAILDSTGQATQLIGVTRDITEHKRIEEERAQALREAQERADRDPLTNLLNHRAFHKRLQDECARAEREGTTLALVMLDLDNFKFFNDVYGHPIGDQVLRQVAEHLRESCRVYDTLSRFGGDEFALILPNIGATPLVEIEARLRANLRFTFQPEGYPSPIPITVSLGTALYPRQNKDWHDLVRIADGRLLQAKTGGTVERDADRTRAKMSQAVEGFSMLDALVSAVDNKDRYTKRHSEDVMAYSLQLAQALGASEALQQTIAAAALLHDVGKIGVPDAILRKPGRLSEEEFAAIRLHPTMGAAIVGAVSGLEDTLDAICYHHERWDGKGYPKGTLGEETPWIARLMAVTDAFSAMTTDRPYRQGMSPEKALSILQEGAGSQWDPAMVAAFIHCRTR